MRIANFYKIYYSIKRTINLIFPINKAIITKYFAYLSIKFTKILGILITYYIEN